VSETLIVWSRRKRRDLRKPRRWCPSGPFLMVLKWGCKAAGFWYSPRYGYRLYCLWDNFVSEWSVKEVFPWEVIEVRKREAPAQVSKNGPVHLADVESKIFAAFPSIIAHLATTRWDDGSSRTPGKIFLETIGTAYMVTAKEPDAKLMLRVSASSLDDALAALDLALAADDAPWEIDRWASDKGFKKK